MNTGGAGSAVPDRRKKRYSQIRSVATLLALGVYLAAATRLIGSEEIYDVVAGRLFALAILISVVALFFALLGQEPAARGSWRRGWTKRRVSLLAFSVVLLASATWSFFGRGTVMNQLLGHTTMIASMLVIAWSSD
ncbi:hypothetical protein OHB26_31805 [Nocardia sp. NBC_01503]|uniref:hypothetical protein n=1 Tax=Nocardia sp. NBC_01503 TaxID=2975997 RepID=UPI002E7B4175|nr:hypothetical protein [Nocardia sp. NBC_01503]WTL31453.1 hypothetical protein OHB26_31805 [Nocardia sp. NBC_01503]